jgi:protein SCO1
MGETQSLQHRNGIIFAIVVIPFFIALVSSWLLFHNDSVPPPKPVTTQQATLLPELRSLAPFSLTDHKGQAFDNSRLLGKWTLLSFGYTHCPDICPTTLAMLDTIDSTLKQQAASFAYQMGFVSIDPERDTPARLAAYVIYFNSDFVGITGSDAALQKLTQPLGILYRKVETKQSAMDYVMDHSASIILVDPQGRYRALFSPPHDPAKMATDILAIAAADKG